MKRGEIRVVGSRVTGRETLALIVGNDALTDLSGWVITAPIDTSGAAPDLLVTVPIGGAAAGVVRLDSIASIRKDRVGRRVDELGQETMDAVDVALRAALDL